jgi:hypothetical protein
MLDDACHLHGFFHRILNRLFEHKKAHFLQEQESGKGESLGTRVIWYLPRMNSKFAKILMATSKNVIPAKAGIQKLLTSLDSRLRGSDKLIIIRGSP